MKAIRHTIFAVAQLARRGYFCVEVKGKFRLKGFEIVEMEEALDR